ATTFITKVSPEVRCKFAWQNKDNQHITNRCTPVLMTTTQRNKCARESAISPHAKSEKSL
ncbi:hypothetical protein, partial [Escherichia coli]|uniref:hypothetical protein n=1 Tax=Escherichia coli TaxID=562 RepID=UPI001BFE5175